MEPMACSVCPYSGTRKGCGLVDGQEHLTIRFQEEVEAGDRPLLPLQFCKWPAQIKMLYGERSANTCGFEGMVNGDM